MTPFKPKPTLLALLKAERQIETEIIDRWKALAHVKAEIAEREVEGALAPERPTMH